MHLDFLFDQRKGHRVVMPLIVDMVINMNPGCLDVTILIVMRLEYRRFQIIRHQDFCAPPKNPRACTWALMKSAWFWRQVASA